MKELKNNRVKKGISSLIIILPILIIIVAIGFFGYRYIKSYNYCHLPIKFAVGNTDSRFKISNQDVIEVAKQIQNKWNNQAGKIIFEYDENAPLKINLVYDTRQASLDKLNQEIGNIKESGQSVESSIDKFKKALTMYQNDLDTYNNKVAHWNSVGGAPSEEYNQLLKEKNELDQRRQSLIESAKLLDIQVNYYNTNLQDLKDKIDKRKNIILTQGSYIPSTNTIDIYTFENTQELGLVLMHELGHAIGLEHAQNPNSIMFNLLEQQDINNPTLTDEDINLLDQKCHLKR